MFPSGNVVFGSSDTGSAAALRAQLDGRVLDAKFALDELARVDTSDTFFSGRLDLEKIGAFGWSFGGATAAELARVDSRCKASAAMHGRFWKTNLLNQPLVTPFLLFRADGPDPDPTDSIIGIPYDDRKAIYDKLTTDAYWVKLTLQQQTTRRPHLSLHRLANF